MRAIRWAWSFCFLMTGSYCCAQPGVGASPFSCTANTKAPVIVRVEGITELVGDLLLQCTGGTPTLPGQPIATTNLRLSLNTNVTSRLLGGSFIDALLLIDDPYPRSSEQIPGTAPRPTAAPPQNVCLSPYGCPGLGAPSGQSPYVSGTALTVFLGRSVSANAIEWNGVPIDPPGTTGSRELRMTNVRANATQLGLSSTLIPTQIVGFVRITGGQFFTINNPQQTLGFIQGGLSTTTPPPSTPSFKQPTISATPVFNPQHCFPHFYPSPPVNASPDAIINIQGDQSLFLRGSFLPNGSPTQPPSFQNIPGFIYNTESGLNGTNFGAPASQGTRLEGIFHVPAGVSIYVANQANSGGNQLTLTSDPFAPFQPVTGTNGIVPVPTQQGIGSVTYEVTGNAPSGPFNVNIPVFTSFNSNGLILGSPMPGPITFEISPPAQQTPPNLGTSVDTIPRFIGNSLSQINQGNLNVDSGQITVLNVYSCFQNPASFSLGAPFNTGNPVVFTQPFGSPAPGSQNVPVTSDPTSLANVAVMVSASSTPKAVPSEGAGQAPAPEAVEPRVSSGWLSVTLSSTSTPLTATLQVNPAGLSPGTYSGTVTFTSQQASPQILPVSLVVMPPGPTLPSVAVFNAASYAPSAVAPGENVDVYGSSFGPNTVAAAVRDAQGRLPTSLAGVTVTFDNVAAPLVYTGKGVVSAMVPFEVTGKQLTVMQVTYQGVKSLSYVLPVLDAVPGLYTADGSGGGQGAILNQDNSYNSSTIPANPGDVVQLFGTGAGQTSPAGSDGNSAQAPYPKPLLAASVTIDGLQADVVYAATAPGEPEGVFQVNVRVPAGVTRGVGVPVVVTWGTKRTQPGVTLAISAAN